MGIAGLEPLEYEHPFLLDRPLGIVHAPLGRLERLHEDPRPRMAAEDHPFPAVLAADGRPVGLRPRLNHARAHHKVGRAPGIAQQAAPFGLQGVYALLHVE